MVAVMGCGQGKMGLWTPKKSKKVEESDEAYTKAEKSSINNVKEEDSPGKKGFKGIKSLTQGGPLLAHITVSESQLDFFKMLDNKIEEGHELDSEEEIEDRNRRLKQIWTEWDCYIQSRPSTQMYGREPSPRHPKKSSRDGSHRPRSEFFHDRSNSKDSLKTCPPGSALGPKLSPYRDDDEDFLSDDSPRSARTSCNRGIPSSAGSDGKRCKSCGACRQTQQFNFDPSSLSMNLNQQQSMVDARDPISSNHVNMSQTEFQSQTSLPGSMHNFDEYNVPHIT